MFARDTKNNMHTQQYISVRDLIENPLFLFWGVRLGFLGVLLGFCIFFVFYILPPCLKSSSFSFSSSSKRESLWVDETATKRGGKSLVERGEHSKPSLPTQRPRTRSACSSFFFVESQHLSLERKRERREEHTRRRGGLGFVSLEKEDAAFGRARLRASVEQLSSLSLIRSREI